MNLLVARGDLAAMVFMRWLMPAHLGENVIQLRTVSTTGIGPDSGRVSGPGQRRLQPTLTEAT